MNANQVQQAYDLSIFDGCNMLIVTQLKTASHFYQSTHYSMKTISTIRIIHEIYCWFSLCLFFPCYHYGGIPLFLLQTVLGGGLACVMDWYISPTMKTNVQRIVQRGLSPSPFLPTSQCLVLLNCYATIVTSESIAVALVVWTGGFEAIPHYDTRLVLNMVYSIAVSEVLFTLSHRYFLHGTNIGARMKLVDLPVLVPPFSSTLETP